MNCAKIVCPFDRELIGRWRERELAVRVADPALIVPAANFVRDSGNRLMCVILDSAATFDQIAFSEEWRDIPLAVMAPALGRFRNLAGRAAALRQLNLRVYLPSSGDNLAGIRILSSVGIPGGIMLESGSVDWEGLADLMTYALLERAAHAPIEPFAYLVKHYHPAARMTIGAAYFDDPAQFMHLDAAGRAAPTRRALLAGEFTGRSDDLETAADGALPAERSPAWRELFAERHACASCPGFRLCLGGFRHDRGFPRGCSAFFTELLDLVEQQQAKPQAAPAAAVWQL